MEYPSNKVQITELKKLLREEQENYILAITAEVPLSTADIGALRNRIRVLQKQLESFGDRYSGL